MKKNLQNKLICPFKSKTNKCTLAHRMTAEDVKCSIHDSMNCIVYKVVDGFNTRIENLENDK